MLSFLLGFVIPSEERGEEGLDSSARGRLGVKKEEGKGVEGCPQTNSQRRLLQTGRKDPQEARSGARKRERGRKDSCHCVRDCLMESFLSETLSEWFEEEKKDGKECERLSDGSCDRFCCF